MCVAGSGSGVMILFYGWGYCLTDVLVKLDFNTDFVMPLADFICAHPQLVLTN